MAGTRLWTQLWFLAGVVVLAPFAFRLAWWQEGFERVSFPDIPSSLRPPGAPFLPFLVVLVGHDFSSSLMEMEVDDFRVALKRVSFIAASSGQENETLESFARRAVAENAAPEMDANMLQYWLVLLPSSLPMSSTEADSSTPSISGITWRLEERFGYARRGNDDHSIIQQAGRELSHARAQISFRPATSTPLPLAREIQLTLVSQDASVRFCRWNRAHLLNRHLNPLVRALIPLTTFLPSLQLLPYGTLLPVQTKHAHGYPLPLSTLTGIRQYWETTLLPPSLSLVATPGPMASPLRFLFYCPASSSEQSLAFMDDVEEGLRGTSNASSHHAVSTGLEIPGWGGALVLPAQNLSSSPPSAHGPHAPTCFLTEATYHHILSFLQPILRTSLGFPPSPPPSLPLPRPQLLHPLEVDSLATHTLSIRHQDTLRSLSILRDLRRAHPGMPFPAHVAEAASAAVQELVNRGPWERERRQKATEDRDRTQGRTLGESGPVSSFLQALARVNTAWAAAQRALEDAALLPPPYYPPEHYAAIFLPLLLPIFLPLLLGLWHEWRRYKEKKKKKKRKSA